MKSILFIIREEKINIPDFIPIRYAQPKQRPSSDNERRPSLENTPATSLFPLIANVINRGMSLVEATHVVHRVGAEQKHSIYFRFRSPSEAGRAPTESWRLFNQMTSYMCFNVVAVWQSISDPCVIVSNGAPTRGKGRVRAENVLLLNKGQIFVGNYVRK